MKNLTAFLIHPFAKVRNFQFFLSLFPIDKKKTICAFSLERYRKRLKVKFNLNANAEGNMGFYIKRKDVFKLLLSGGGILGQHDFNNFSS